ncbi:MAG: terminase family protein, partial [bacterium]|nr:terminase family protein [bacterium]
MEFFETVGRINGEPIRFYPYQRQVLTCPDRFVLWLKARQTGASWGLGCRALYKALFDPATRWGYLAAGERQGKEWLEEVLMMWEELPSAWRLPTRVKTTTRLAFRHGGSISILPVNPGTVRSGRFSDLMLDEFAHVADDKALMAAALPRISRSKHGGLYIVSTPLGQRGMFHRMWTDREQFPQFRRMETPWQDCPDLDPEVISIARATLGDEGFAQEYELSFLDETLTFFPYDLFLANQGDIEV